MAKEAVFTMKLEPELRDAFMAAAHEEDRPASQIVRELMRDFIDRRVATAKNMSNSCAGRSSGRGDRSRQVMVFRRKRWKHGWQAVERNLQRQAGEADI